MGSFKTLGTIVYYSGAIVMLVGLFFLISGVVQTVSTVSAEVRSSGNGDTAPACANPPCINATVEEQPPAFLIMLESVFSQPVDYVMNGIGISNTGDKQMDALFYSKFRRFFTFMGMGLSLILLGILLKLFDSIDSYATRGKKMPAADQKERMRAGSAPEKNWVKYIENKNSD